MRVSWRCRELCLFARRPFSFYVSPRCAVALSALYQHINNLNLPSHPPIQIQIQIYPPSLQIRACQSPTVTASSVLVRPSYLSSHTRCLIHLWLASIPHPFLRPFPQRINNSSNRSPHQIHLRAQFPLLLLTITIMETTTQLLPSRSRRRLIITRTPPQQLTRPITSLR